MSLNHPNEDEQCQAVYEELKKLDGPLQWCPVCGESGAKNSMDRHHVAGRSFGNLLHYIYLHRGCHRKVHDDPEWAEKQGLLWKHRNTRSMTSSEWGILMSRLKIK